MFTRKALISSFGRGAALATVAALALTAFEPSTAQAGTSTPAKGAYAATGTSGATDISAARRYYRGGGGAAAAAAFAGIVGTGLAIAASQDRGYYGPGYGYYSGGPYESYGYYGGPPAYYGGDGYYGGGYGYRSSGVPHYRGHPLAGW